MKIRVCLACGKFFEANLSNQHTCGCEDGAADEHDERVSRETNDPAVKARIEAKLWEALDVDLTMTRAREKREESL